MHRYHNKFVCLYLSIGKLNIKKITCYRIKALTSNEILPFRPLYDVRLHWSELRLCKITIGYEPIH